MSDTNWLEILQLIENSTETKDNNEKRKHSYISATTGQAITESAFDSSRQVAERFTKPDKYDRKLYDNGMAKKRTKTTAFSKGEPVRDPYTGAELELTVSDAKLKYGKEWTKHLAEADHIVPLEKVHNKYKNNPFLTNDNLKDMANSPENLQTIGRNVNNAKRNRTNEELVKDKDYLEKTGLELTSEGAQDAIKAGRKAEKYLYREGKKNVVENALKVGNEAGKAAGKESGIMAGTMSGIMNIAAVIKGEKDPGEALFDTAVDSAKGGATGYVMGGGLTVMSQGLSASSSKFLQALSASNVPGKVITAVMTTGDVLTRYGRGEISTQECILQLGERGLNCATASYSMAVGQALIPIPIVGAAVGALVGSVLTSGLYHGLIDSLQRKELEHQERQRIIEESKIVAAQARAFRVELEDYLAKYFKEYQDCFDEALLEMKSAFQTGDTDGVIVGANKITRKLGGNVQYETAAEFEEFLMDGSVDIL